MPPRAGVFDILSGMESNRNRFLGPIDDRVRTVKVRVVELDVQFRGDDAVRYWCPKCFPSPRPPSLGYFAPFPREPMLLKRFDYVEKAAYWDERVFEAAMYCYMGQCPHCNTYYGIRNPAQTSE